MGGENKKQKTRGSLGAQPSESVPVEKQKKILMTKFPKLGSKPKSRDWIIRGVLEYAREAKIDRKNMILRVNTTFCPPA